jgi:hypothetical protein
MFLISKRTVAESPLIISTYIFLLSPLFRSGQLEVIEPLLEALRDQGLTISLSVAQFVRDKVSESQMTLAAADLLAELTSGDLIPVPLNPLPKRLQFGTNSQARKNITKFCAFARERKLHEALASKKVGFILF